MTDKRFTMIYFGTDGNLIFDENKHTGEWYDSTECLQDQDIVDLLNELHEEVIELNNECAKYLSDKIKDYEQFKECADKCKELHEENMKLKQKIMIS